jgi:hypothetical protein
MTRNPPHQRDVLTTNVTIIQLQAELLRRQARRRADLTETDRRWLELALATIVQATHEISELLVEDPESNPLQLVGSMPTQRLTAPSSRPHRN